MGGEGGGAENELMFVSTYMVYSIVEKCAIHNSIIVYLLLGPCMYVLYVAASPGPSLCACAIIVSDDL